MSYHLYLHGLLLHLNFYLWSHELFPHSFHLS
nr:MAG TPA: hypothetical protein [Caudoviricetes sp.]